MSGITQVYLHYNPGGAGRGKGHFEGVKWVQSSGMAYRIEDTLCISISNWQYLYK